MTVAIGLISLKLLPIPYSLCISTLAIVLYSNLQKIPSLEVISSVKFAVSHSFASCLIQWVAMVIFSGFVCRWSLNQLTPSAIIHTLSHRFFFIICICVSVSSLGSGPFESITYDWGVLFSFLLAQTMNTVRVATQGMNNYYVR